VKVVSGGIEEVGEIEVDRDPEGGAGAADSAVRARRHLRAGCQGFLGVGRRCLGEAGTTPCGDNNGEEAGVA
jgi:hypothetical protein